MIRCTSCNKEVTDNYVKFKCPEGGETEIIRCDKCRQNIVTYECPECGFEGP